MAQQPLTGKALLNKVKKSTGLAKRELAKECGYFTKTKAGKTRVNVTGFLNALLEAEGVNLNGEGKKSQRGRDATFRASVHKNGQLILGPAYTEKANLKPGDLLEINLGYKHIRLIRVNSESEAS